MQTQIHMDIVARLNSFINQLGMPITQVADSCGIPRPSMTQLLKGRNQKISDDVLRKLHVRVPRLNILWLLCGEGDMLLDGNNETSEAQTGHEMNAEAAELSVNQMSQQTIDFGNKSSSADTVLADFGSTVDDSSVAFENSGVNVGEIVSPVSANVDKKTISFVPGVSGEKKIVNIIIYYNDNSFEAFVPKDQRKD